MADTELRVLERRWRETGAVDDEAALLVVRQRAGLLDPARLRAAASLGHPAALLASGPAPRDLAAQLAGVFATGRGPALVRLACAAVEQVLTHVAPTTIPPMARGVAFDGHSIGWLLLQADAWLGCPCPEHAFRMPAHFYLSEHELAVDLAGLLHYAGQDPRGGRDLQETTAGILRLCAHLRRVSAAVVLRDAGRLEAERLLAG